MRRRNWAAWLAGTTAFAAAAAGLARRRRRADLRGQVALVFGGSRGLGLALARELGAAGCRLVIAARDEGELAEARRELEARGAEVLAQRCDVGNAPELESVVAAARGRFGAIDVLVNVAGLIHVGPAESMTLDNFRDALAVNFWAPLRAMDAVVAEMRARRRGRIVNITSIGGRIAVPHLAPYCASKFALVGLSDAVRTELEQYGIRVTTVTPGLMRTGSPRNADMKGQHEAEYAWFSIADSLPGLSASAETAAAQIIEACRYGDPELTITLPAKIVTAANHFLPGLVAHTLMVANRMLPGVNGATGDQNKRGADSASKWAPSAATVLTDKAAVVNNEV